MNRIILLVFSVFLIYSCQSKSVDLPNFDEQAWKNDGDGCQGARSKMRSQLIEVKSQLKGLNGDEIIAVLGKPNSTNLASRNQRYFTYNISCHTDSLAYSLSIRFNAVGLAYEVVVY